MLVGIVQVDDVQVVARSVVVKERHGSIHVEDAEPFCMEGGRDGASIGGEMDSSGGGEGGEEEKSAVSRNKEEKHGRMERELSLIHISEPTRPRFGSRMPSSA